MNKIIIMGTPHHGNLGDSAIAISEENIIMKEFPNYELLQIPEKFLTTCVNKAKSFIDSDDIIILHGGGNIGDTYITPEKGRREVIKLFPNNKIIIMPQTAYFSDTESGKMELNISKKIYNSHKDLTIMAREKKSYEFMKEHFYNAKVYLTPDIVMTIYKPSDKMREGVTLMFRGDKEKNLQSDSIDKIKEIIKKNYDKVNISDMHLGEDVINIGGKIREKALEDKFAEFQSSELVVTDRLHGMIFSAITETPCIAFKSKDHKITESYDWLKNLEYIELCDSIEDFEDALKKVTSTKNRRYDNTFAKNAILEILRREIK